MLEAPSQEHHAVHTVGWCLWARGGGPAAVQAASGWSVDQCHYMDSWEGDRGQAWANWLSRPTGESW